LIAYHAAQSYVLSSELRLEPETLGPRTARALSWSTLAGDRALALYATEQAATHYALAIDAGLRQHSDIALLERLYVGRGRALELRGAYDDAIVAYEALERVAADRGDERMRAEALAHQATIYRTPTTRFDAKRADGLLDAALKIARALDDRVLIAQVQRDQIHIRLARGQVEPAIVAGEESLAAAAAAGSREQLMYTSTDIVCAYREAGQLQRARTAAILAADLANELDDKPMGANSRWAWGHLEFTDGNYDEATRLWNEGIGIAEASDNFWGRSLNVGASASIRFERGDLGGAIRSWEESLRLAEAVGFIVPPALYRGDLAWCYRTAGAGGHADRHLEATRTFVESHFPSYGAGLLGLLSRAATAHGTLDAAATYLAQAEVELAAKTELFAFQHAHVGLAAVELMLARRDYDGAITEARARGDVQRGLMRPYVADFEYLEGEALRLEGTLDAAAQMLSRARATAAALGGRRILWRVLASLASAEEARGNAAAAELTRAEARAIASGIAESLRPMGFAPGFLAQADVSELMAAVAPSA
jgi:tetratricopeptide (TPR) repeat protein